MKRSPYDLWLNMVAESVKTRSGYLKTINAFESWAKENYGLDVEAIPKDWREAKYAGGVAQEKFLDVLRDILKDYFAWLKGLYTPMTVNRSMSTVMSYLHAFDVPVKPIRLKHAYVTYHNRDLAKEDIRRILDHSSIRNRAIYLVLYETGMRPDTLTNLKWRHVKDEFLGHKIPMKIELTSDILKCRVSERWTFIGKEGFEALKKYLTTRLPLKEEDYLFVKEKGCKDPGGQFGQTALSQAFNKMVKKLGIAESRGKMPKDIRLYCLRKAFRKYMQTEEAYKEFWMGHTSTATHYVSRDPEYHRQLYAQGYENLRLYRPEADHETVVRLMKENMELKQRVDRLETILEEFADLKAQIKREKKIV